MTGNDDEDVRSVPDQLTLLDFYSCSTLNIRRILSSTHVLPLDSPKVRWSERPKVTNSIIMNIYIVKGSIVHFFCIFPGIISFVTKLSNPGLFSYM